MIPSEPVYRPPVPFADNFGVLRPGCMFTIQGYFLPTGQRFSVNLASGNVVDGPMRSDIAFHFNPRLDQKYVARNTFQSQVWGPEEGDQPVFPFQGGQNFEIMILVEPMQYKVAVNGLHFIIYNHRMPLERVNTLQVVGDVQINMLMFTDPAYAGQRAEPPGLPYGTPPLGPAGPQGGPPTLYDPAVPFEHIIPGGMYPGKTILMSGRPTTHADRFHVNLICATGYKGPDTIALHFNPRMPEAMVVRNSLIDGYWGEEERHIPNFPFVKDAFFDLRIVCEPDKFAIFVNGQPFCNFIHRLPFNYIEKVAVEGDTTVASLNFQG